MTAPPPRWEQADAVKINGQARFRIGTIENRFRRIMRSATFVLSAALICLALTGCETTRSNKLHARFESVSDITTTPHPNAKYASVATGIPPGSRLAHRSRPRRPSAVQRLRSPQKPRFGKRNPDGAARSTERQIYPAIVTDYCPGGAACTNAAAGIASGNRPGPSHINSGPPLPKLPSGSFSMPGSSSIRIRCSPASSAALSLVG
jgi:hypothetical protein